MFKLKQSWMIGVTLFLVACSGVEPINWIEKLEKSDRLSSIKGMLSELKAFEEQIDVMTSIKEGVKEQKSKSDQDEIPSFNQIDRLLSLDHSPINETEEDVIRPLFEEIRDARDARLDEEDIYIEQHKANYNLKETQNLIAARKHSQEVYKKKSLKILPFLQEKLSIKNKTYALALIEKYNTGEPCRHLEIVDALRKMGNHFYDKDPKKFKKSPLYQSIGRVLIHSLKNDIQSPPRTALIASGTLERWESDEHINEYISLMKRDKIHFDLKNMMVKLVTQFAKIDQKAVLLDILNTSPHVQPIFYIAQSAKALGQLKVDDAIDRLIECLWLDDARGRSATSQCRLALNQLNPKQVAQAALKTFKRQNKKVEERGIRLNYAHTGLIEAKSAEILGDVSDNQTIPTLIRSLTHQDQNSEVFSKNPAQATFFVKGQIQKTISIAHTLAILGESAGAKVLMSIIQDKEKLFEYKLASSQQLAYLGDDTPVKDLLKIFNKKLERYDIGNRDLRVQYSKTIALLIRHKDRGLKSFTKGIDNNLKEVQEWIKETEAQIQAEKDKQKGFDEEIKALRVKVRALKDKGVKIPKRPKREKIPKMEDQEEYKKKQEAAQAVLVEALKKYEEALTDDQKSLRKLENEIETKQKNKTKSKNFVFEVERMLKIYQTWETGFKTIQTQIKLLNQCKDDLSCWSNNLSGKSLPVRTLATYVLSRKSSDSKVAAKTLIGRLMEEDPAVRDVVLFGVARHAKNSDIEAIKKIRDVYEKKRENGSTDKSLKGTVYSLDLILAQLSH